MRLSEYLRETKTTQKAFADSIGVTQGRVSQLIKGDMPAFDRAVDLLTRISAATAGKVTAADFRASESQTEAAE